MKAKKHLGQHFLNDALIIQRILSSILSYCPTDEALLEVGPGQGAISKDLSRHYNSFRLVEFDRDMVEILLDYFDESMIINRDFLGLNLAEVFDGAEFNLVGNFPYNISSQIVFKILENRSFIPCMVGMFQKEVAERICSTPGGKSNGILSLNVQAWYDAEILFHIGPESFYPPPKVQSSVIVMRRKVNSDIACDAKLYKRVIKQAFQQRRKKLRNTLKSYGIDMTDEIYQRRPEELGVDDFVSIVLNIQNNLQNES